VKRFLFVAASLATSTSAYADEPRAAPPEYVAEPAPEAPPLGHHGFQMAVRSGVSLPLGNAKDSFADEAARPEHWSSSMSDLAGLQIPVTVDIGGKPNPHLFIGGYLTYAMGLTAGRLADACDRLPLDCYSTNVRFGAQIHYVFSPHERITPWVGYGFGYSWMTAGDGAYEARFHGFDIAHFLAGLDLRLSRTFGIGPYIDFGLGIYGHQELSGNPHVDGAINGQAVHQWFTFGPRLVVLP
jgi:hypothetical protein